MQITVCFSADISGLAPIFVSLFLYDEGNMFSLSTEVAMLSIFMLISVIRQLLTLLRKGSDKYTQNRCHRELRKINECQQFAHTEPMLPRIAETQRMSTPNKKFVKSMIILGCNWLTMSKIKKQRESLVSLVCYGWKGRR